MREAFASAELVHRYHPDGPCFNRAGCPIAVVQAAARAWAAYLSPAADDPAADAAGLMEFALLWEDETSAHAALQQLHQSGGAAEAETVQGAFGGRAVTDSGNTPRGPRAGSRLAVGVDTRPTRAAKEAARQYLELMLVAQLHPKRRLERHAPDMRMHAR